MVCGRAPRGCTKEEEGEDWVVVAVCEGVKADVVCSVADFVGGARAFSGCWRMEIRSSTRRAEAIGAAPGRVTVHCWSRVASLRDYEEELVIFCVLKK